MNNLFPKTTPEDVQKSPLGYTMLIMAALLGWFVNWSLSSQDRADKHKTEILQKSVEDCRLDVERERKKNEMLQTRVDYLTNIFIKSDSANRAILDKPVKDLLKQVKK
jgi:hypothetical protein